MAPAMSKAVMPAMSILGQSTVILSSLVVVGSFFWVPMLLIYCLRKCKTWKSRLAVVTFFLLITLVPLKVLAALLMHAPKLIRQETHIAHSFVSCVLQLQHLCVCDTAGSQEYTARIFVGQMARVFRHKDHI
jgi:hypothetical protein